MSEGQVTLQVADRQALSVMQAIRDVAAQLEKQRDFYRQANSEDRRRQSRDILLFDIDRLSNLVCLLESVPPSDLHIVTQKALDETLDHLRNRIAKTGASLALGKIQELRLQAEAFMQRHEYPVGKSFLLKERFVRYFDYLRNLVKTLTAENCEVLVKAARSINKLIDFDRRSPIPSFSGDRDITPIDVQEMMSKMGIPAMSPAAVGATAVVW